LTGPTSASCKTSGSANTALITATGRHARRRARGSPAADDGRLPGQARIATGTATIAGTMSRKAACPWMRNQPDSAAIQASAQRPAATDASETANVRKAGTYTYGIQSELNTAGCSAPSSPRTAPAASAPRADLVQP